MIRLSWNNSIACCLAAMSLVSYSAAAQENAALKAEVEHSQKNAPMTAWADRIEEMNRKVMRLANIHSALTEKEEVR